MNATPLAVISHLQVYFYISGVYITLYSHQFAHSSTRIIGFSRDYCGWGRFAVLATDSVQHLSRYSFNCTPFEHVRDLSYYRRFTQCFPQRALGWWIHISESPAQSATFARLITWVCSSERWYHPSIQLWTSLRRPYNTTFCTYSRTLKTGNIDHSKP